MQQDISLISRQAAPISFLFFYHRLEDYDRNDNFQQRLEIPQEDIIYSVQWPNEDCYENVSASTAVPILDIEHINTYFLEQYKDNADITEYAADHTKG